MSIIHRTTLAPTKLELLTSWLPGRPWYAGEGAPPRLTKAGGFRLDDPAGEVGLEFMAATDDSGDEPVTYHVPLTYRGAPLAGGDAALIGTTQHGVLGKRWVYDGTRDRVLVTQLFAFLLGEAEPQAQSIGDTVDPSVTRSIAGQVGTLPAEIGDVTDHRGSTDIIVRPADTPGPLMLRVNRVLRPHAAGLMTGSLGHVTAEWPGPAFPGCAAASSCCGCRNPAATTPELTRATGTLVRAGAQAPRAPGGRCPPARPPQVPEALRQGVSARIW